MNDESIFPKPGDIIRLTLPDGEQQDRKWALDCFFDPYGWAAEVYPGASVEVIQAADCG